MSALGLFGLTALKLVIIDMAKVEEVYAPFRSIAKAFLLDWEDDEEDTADYRLGLEAINVGVSLKQYSQGNWLSPAFGNWNSVGLKPSEVGDWILKNLKQ